MLLLNSAAACLVLPLHTHMVLLLVSAAAAAELSAG